MFDWLIDWSHFPNILLGPYEHQSNNRQFIEDQI